MVTLLKSLNMCLMCLKGAFDTCILCFQLFLTKANKRVLFLYKKEATDNGIGLVLSLVVREEATIYICCHYKVNRSCYVVI